MKTGVNFEERVGKSVGRRTAVRDSLAYASGLQKTLHQLSLLRIPRGVYRFTSHEEADAWLMAHLTKKKES